MFQRLLPVCLALAKPQPVHKRARKCVVLSLGVLGLPMSAPSAGLSGSLRCLRDLEPQKLGCF